MDYSTFFFGKQLNEISYQDIVDFFKEERTESDLIEFKSINPIGKFDEKFIGIQKSVCAFLNSNGGILIWGAPEGKYVEGKKEKVFKGDLTHFPSTIEKDYAVSKISDSIIPLPSSFKFNIISHMVKSIAVIEIAPSDYSPHQTRDTYYMRIDGQTRPAPHHYIEALFKKIRYPNIEVFVSLKKIGLEQSKLRIEFDFIFFNWSPLQNEEMLSYRVIVDNGIFSRSQFPQYKNSYRFEGHEYFNEKAKEIFYFGEPIVESEVLVFDQKYLAQKGNKAKLLISFGGRFSPRKSSEYTFDFTKAYNYDLNNLIVEKKENYLTKDFQEMMGVDRTKALKAFKII